MKTLPLLFVNVLFFVQVWRASGLWSKINKAVLETTIPITAIFVSAAPIAGSCWSYGSYFMESLKTSQSNDFARCVEIRFVGGGQSCLAA